MGRTVTLNGVKNHSVSELLQEAVQTHQPLIVTLEDGTAVSIQQYQPSAELTEEMPILKPLLTLPGSVPSGWKDEFYDQTH